MHALHRWFTPDSASSSGDILITRIIIVMETLKSHCSYDQFGKPRNYVDETRMGWVYVGKRDGIDEWEGTPKDDGTITETSVACVSW